MGNDRLLLGGSKYTQNLGHQATQFEQKFGSCCYKLVYHQKNVTRTGN